MTARRLLPAVAAVLTSKAAEMPSSSKHLSQQHQVKLEGYAMITLQVIMEYWLQIPYMDIIVICFRSCILLLHDQRILEYQSI